MTWEEQNKLIQGYLRDFDTLFKEQSAGDISTMKFVKYNNKSMDVTEYVQTRLSELNK